MKKLKLSKSKVADVKQAKISNFFIASRAVGLSKQDEELAIGTQDIKQKKPGTDLPSRVLSERVCIKCLQKLPINGSVYCITCDSKVSSEIIDLTDLKCEKADYFKKEIINDTSISELSTSPDVIPSTPCTEFDVLKKTKIRSKFTSVKRKCNFGQNSHAKKINSSKENLNAANQPSSSIIGKDNKFVSDDKENISKYRDHGNSLPVNQNSKKELHDLCTIEGIENSLTRFNCSQETPDVITTKREEDSIQSAIKDSGTKNEYVNNNGQDILLNIDEIDELPSNFFEDFSFCNNELKKSISLHDNVRCEVISKDNIQSCGEVVLALKPCDSTNSEEMVTCVLRGTWINTSVNAGDIVNVSASPVEGQESCWVVDDNSGSLTVHPDILVSGTSVVGALFCMRRSVLTDMYRGIDSDSSIMVIGSFLHQLLQEVLKRRIKSLEGIKEVFNEFISSYDFIFNLYSSQMSLEKTKESLFEFIPKIYAFIQKYIPMDSKPSKVFSWKDAESWRGEIMEVADIEENIWSPRLGVKGKVDVTVNTLSQGKQSVMPLELKTGRASFSAEHRGQVILYTMMMTELGQDVNSGLLLYLRENVMKEVKVGAAERRDLTMLRNQLVTELEASHGVVFTNSRQISAPTLPQPIHHHSACAKCPYLTICSAALRVNGVNELSESNPLLKLYETSTSHLQMEHIVYVFHWTGLLRLEHTDARQNSTALRDIWTMSPDNRMKRGSCIANARLTGDVVEVMPGSYQHIFEWSSSGNSASGLAEGDYVIVSSDSRPAVAAGPLKLVSNNKLSIYLERDLSNHKSKTHLWHIDKYESQTGLVFNMTNLGCLLDNTEQAIRLRKAVIDLEIPKFCTKLSGRVLKASKDLLEHLNKQQCRAIFRALSAEHYILIKGMPGTGKTATIVALVELAVRLGLSVLITSHTHSAVDNVLLRLRGRVDFLRLGTPHRIHPLLVQYADNNRDFTSPDQLSEHYNKKVVVAVTCLGSSHAVLARRQFDLCLVDEATQVLQPTVLRPLFSAHKFILIGDPNQLPPLVRSRQAKELGLRESLFERLDRPAVTSELTLQYRMNQKITDLANTLTYAGKLECASPLIASATLTLPNQLDIEVQPEWMKKSLSTALEMSVVVLDTGVTESVDCANTFEADIVCKILDQLKKAGLSDDKAGVIAPYRAQVELLRKQIRSDSQVEVNTVDQYQGRDKDVILYSCTRSAKPTEADILGDKNRLTVAITRARHKLVIIGNVTLLRGYPIFNTLFQSLPLECVSSLC